MYNCKKSTSKDISFYKNYRPSLINFHKQCDADIETWRVTVPVIEYHALHAVPLWQLSILWKCCKILLGQYFTRISYVVILSQIHSDDSNMRLVKRLLDIYAGTCNWDRIRDLRVTVYCVPMRAGTHESIQLLMRWLI